MNKKQTKIILLATLLVILVGVVSATEVSDDTITTDTTTTDEVVHQAQTTTSTTHGSEAVQPKEIQKEEKKTKTATKTYDVNDFDSLESALTSESYDTVTVNIKSNITLTDTTTLNEAIKTLTINGNGKTIDGQNNYQFLHVDHVDVTLKNLKIINCGGGAIFTIFGDLTVYDCTFNNNTGDYGGAIYGEKVTIYNSTFNNNTADNGGAIYADQLTIYNSTFNNNKATNNGGAIDEYTLTIYNSTFNNNTADNGGAIYNHECGTLITYNSTFNNNQANIGGAITDNGGAIIDDIIGTITTYDSTFNNNTANYGGAVYNEYSTLTITNSTLNNNVAEYGGGAIYNTNRSLTINHSTLSGNSAQYFESYGGAIYNTGDLTINHSTLSNNYAVLGGGAIYNTNGNVTINHSTLSNNSASKDFGSYGGAIYNTGDLTIYNSSINNSHAQEYGGAIYNTGILTINNSILSNNIVHIWGGAISNFYGNVTITNCTLNNNNAGDSGGAIWNSGTLTITDSMLNNNSGPEGGAIYNENELTVVNCTLNNNAAYTIGGAISIYNGKLTITNSKLINNTAGYSGGAIYNFGDLTIYNSSLNNNRAEVEGGAITGFDSPVIIINSTLNNNKAENNGGAIKTDRLNITGSVLTNNTAINGSAIYNDGWWATIYNNTFVTNRASMLEKAIIDETGTAEIRDNVNDETSIDYGTIYTNNYEYVSIIGNIFYDGRINTTITISSNNTNPMVTDKIKFTFTLKDQSSQSISNQKILVNIADRQYNLTTNTNGIATLDYTLVKVGTQAITAVYNGSTEYGPSNTTLNFTVNKKDTTITINDIPDTQYSDRVTITGGFTRSTGEAIKNATIVLTINGANYHYNTKTDVNGNYALNLTTNKLGTNNVTATFNGNSVYNSASTTKTFTVNKIDTVILLDDISDVEYSDTVAITGAFKRITGESIANVNIVLTVNGVMYKTKTDSNGNYTLNYTATKVGTNNVTASFNAISVYNRCNTSKTFTVIKKDTSITLDSIPVADYSDKLTITGGFTRSTGEAIKNATIVLMINGAKYNTKTDANGNYALNYTATKVGTNNVTASFNGNSVYNSVNTSKTFMVNKKDTSIILNYIPNVQYSDKVVLAGKLTRSTGEKIANANIVVFINGVNYTTKTDANGNYALNYTATRVGTNNVAAWFAGNSVYNEVDTSRTFTVSKKDTSITLNYIADTPYSDKVTITGKFTRSTGEAVKNATITLMVNGVKYNTKTDANGNYALNYTATKVGTNNVTAIFNGNSVYNGADTSKTFTVTKKDTKITINSIATTKISNKVTITGKLTRSTGEVLKNATVTVKVNNVNYNVKTDANGLYTLNYTTNKVGTNNVTASFNGNSVYNSGSATRTFKVTN